MNTRKLHRILGLVLLLPLIGWVVTGVIFFVKPGYSGAYEFLQPKSYPMEGRAGVYPPGSKWLEMRRVKTVLGEHLIIREEDGWKQLDPETLGPRPVPNVDEIRMLVGDAISMNPTRYGSITGVDSTEITTSTNVKISLDWDRLSLYQRGDDTELIDTIYKIHYLQWTGIDAVDKVLGGAGLVLLTLLSLLGFRLSFRR